MWEAASGRRPPCKAQVAGGTPPPTFNVVQVAGSPKADYSLKESTLGFRLNQQTCSDQSSAPRTFSKARIISSSSCRVRHDGIASRMLRSNRLSATGQVPL